LRGGSNINILNSRIGLNSSYGLVVVPSDEYPIVNNINIESNIFDTGFILDYSWIATMGTGADVIGSNDGIVFQGGVEYSKIHNNYFKNWNHSSIGMSTTSPLGNHHIEISNNTMTSPDVTYGGRVGYSGNVYEVEFHHNLMINTSVRNQIRGFKNHFHHNIIDTITYTTIKEGTIGQGVGLTSSNGKVYDNLFEYNTFKNCDGAAIYIDSYGNDSQYTIYNNTFSNNIFENNGLNEYYAETDIYISKGAGAYQIFKNNYISSDTISYERKYISISDFNLLSDKIDGNTNIMPKDSSIGAGDEAYIGSTLDYK